MFFTLKKFISWWLEPANISLILTASGLILLWTKRHFRLGRVVLTAGLCVLAVFSNGAVARWLALSLESRFPPIADWDPAGLPPSALTGVRYVAVLGGGHADTAGFSANNKLSSPSLTRLIEGVRLVRALPQATLIVSGGPSPDSPLTGAMAMQQTAIALGVDPSRIRRFDTTRDTMDEAEALKAEIGAAPFVLVTSALHLPRAVGLVQKVGLNPVPSPAGFTVRPREPFHLRNQLWFGAALETSSAALHEYLGLFWARLRGGA